MPSTTVANVRENGVLASLDETLRELIQSELQSVGLGPVEVTFEAPERDRTATWPSPAVNLFLYDLREPAMPRDRTWHTRNSDGGGAFMARGPFRVECSYAITVWARDPLDEHRLLSQVLSILLAYPELPPPVLAPELMIGDPPVSLPTRVAHGKEHGRADFWNAIGSPYKVSLEYAVTVFFEPGLRRSRGPRVGARSVGGPAPAGGQPGDRAPVRAIGGQVLRADGGVAAGAWVQLPELGLAGVTDAAGRFSVRGVPDGTFAIEARGAAGETAGATIPVPGPPVTLRFAG